MSMDDLPPIDPAQRAEFDKEFMKILFPPKGKVIYSDKFARRIAKVILSGHKKAPGSARRLTEALAKTPELDRLVAKQITGGLK